MSTTYYHANIPKIIDGYHYFKYVINIYKHIKNNNLILFDETDVSCLHVDNRHYTIDSHGRIIPNDDRLNFTDLAELTLLQHGWEVCKWPPDYTKWHDNGTALTASITTIR